MEEQNESDSLKISFSQLEAKVRFGVRAPWPFTWSAERLGEPGAVLNNRAVDIRAQETGPK
jgi:hypothetical protein